MTARQYKNARTRLALSQDQLAKKLKISERQVRRRENEEIDITFEAELAIKFLELAKRKPK